jgi:hypothetical protein
LLGILGQGVDVDRDITVVIDGHSASEVGPAILQCGTVRGAKR